MADAVFAERYLVQAFPSGGVVVDLQNGNYFRVDPRAAIACAALVNGDAASATAEVAARLTMTPEHAQKFVSDTRAALDAVQVRGTPTGPYHFHPERGGYGLWHAGNRVLAVREPDFEILVPRGGGIEESPLLEFYVRAVAPKIMFARGLSILHAAACAIEDTLIAFAGQSGAGKTTTVRAFVNSGARPISEDLLVFKPGAGRPRVTLGSEVRVHAWAKDAAQRLAGGVTRVPSDELAMMAEGPEMALGTVLFLDASRRAGSAFELRRLDGADALLALMANDFLGASSREAWRQFVATATELTSAVELIDATAPLGVELLERAATRYMSSRTS
jgi:hypothetical protein